MSGKIVDNILAQVNALPNSTSVKKLLLLRLEVEFNSQRCNNYDDWNPNYQSQQEKEKEVVHDLSGEQEEKQEPKEEQPAA